MLHVETPYPHIGSFALLVDVNLPLERQRAELVRIQRRGAGVTVSFPLRAGASGNRIVEEAELIDGTPLNRDEQRELADLQRRLRGKPRGRKDKAVRAEALRGRAIFSILLESELAKLRSIEARQQPSIGQPIRHAA